jgi:hypothetical protein
MDASGGEISNEDKEIYFAMMDINNARRGRLELIQDPVIRALCIESNPSLASSYASTHRAEEEHKRRIRSNGLMRRSKRARAIARNTEENSKRDMIRRRIRVRGYTREEVCHIFEEINKWLPSRYDYILAKAEGIGRRASNNLFARTKMNLRAEVALGTGQLRGELFEESSSEEFEEETEVERIQRLSRMQERERQGGERVLEEDDFDELEGGLTTEQAKTLYIESKVMVDATAICTKDCSITRCLNEDYLLYGCNDHGLIHLCLAGESCIHQSDNRDKDLVCVFSGMAVNKMYRGPRAYNNKRQSVAADVEGIERSRTASSVIQKEYMDAISSLKNSIYGGGEGGDTENGLLDSELVEFVQIGDKEFNMAMVDSAIRSGEGCVITPLAASILTEKFFVDRNTYAKKPEECGQKEEDEHEEEGMVPNEEKDRLDVVARELATTTSNRGLLTADRGSFLNDSIGSPTQSSGRFSGAFSGGKTPFLSGIASAAAEGAFISPESRKEGVGPSVIPSEDFVITGDTFVTSDVLREISAEGTSGFSGFASSGPSSATNGGGSPVMVVGRKENALFSSSHRVMCTSPATSGSLRRCNSPTFSSPLGRGGGVSPLKLSASPHREGPYGYSKLDKETQYEINPYRGVQKRLRQWEKVMRTGEHPSDIMTPSLRRSTDGGISVGLGGRASVPKTPVATPRQVKEQEAILQSQAGVVMKRRKRGRNSLVRSVPVQLDEFAESGLPGSGLSGTRRITRGSKPGRSKKNQDLYTQEMYQVYMPSRKSTRSDTAVETESVHVEQSKMVEHRTLHSSSPRARFAAGSPNRSSSPSPLLRKVLTSGKESSVRQGSARSGTERVPSIEVHKDQYFLVKGEKPRNRNTNLKAIAMLNRSRKLRRMKRKKLKGGAKDGTQEKEMSESTKNDMRGRGDGDGDGEIPRAQLEATEIALMGHIADTLIGRPSRSSIYRIAKSGAPEHSSDALDRSKPSSVARKDGESQGGTVGQPLLQTRVQKNMLQSKRIAYSSEAVSPTIPLEGESGSSPSGEKEKDLVRTRSKGFRAQMERFTRWIENKTLVFSDDMDQYKNSIRTVMNDLIFSYEKRRSMQEAYRYVSLVGAKDTIKACACKASRALKRRKLSHASEDGGDSESQALMRYRRVLTLGAIDDVFGRLVSRNGIRVIPNNEAKLRKYSNEIYYLWRLLLTSKYAADLKNPKAQFDHFVLGVLYLLAERDVVLCDTVVMKHDPWLKESLPRRERLCENYTSKLKKNEVARLIQTQTNLKMDSLTFSTPSRVYNTRIITRGRTRVKDLVFNFNQEVASHQFQESLRAESQEDLTGGDVFPEIGGLLVKTYLARNSTIEFVKLGQTKGNIRRAARVYKRRKGLFH